MGSPAARIVALAVCAACGGPPPAPPIANGAPGVADTHSDAERLIAAVLQRYLDDPSTMPDHGLLPQAGAVAIAREIRGGGSVTAGAVPAGGRGFAVRGLADLQAQADRRGESVAFIHFTKVEIAADHAVVGVGVDVALPAAAGGVKMCCCRSYSRYLRRGDGWVFGVEEDSICS